MRGVIYRNAAWIFSELISTALLIVIIPCTIFEPREEGEQGEKA
jgi:hypothetical protein